MTHPNSPQLPNSLRRLNELAYNLWWTWYPEAEQLFDRLDPEGWWRLERNPVALLQGLDPDRAARCSADGAYVQLYQRVMAAFDSYMRGDDTWFDRHYPHLSGRHGLIAFFSAEFGLHESLPVYSGGLGVLAGDLCKAASDLGVPLVGCGFLYPQGYFIQSLDGRGHQHALYRKLDFSRAPLSVPRAGNLIVSVPVGDPQRDVLARVWEVRVGRVQVYLLDTDVEGNGQLDRELTYRLYGGDQRVRVAQEIILGIGGMRALHRLGIRPQVLHLNEGHTAFAPLERIRQVMEDGKRSFDLARAEVELGTLFTTHTPVRAGHDRFSDELVAGMLDGYWRKLGLERAEFLQLGEQRDDVPQPFSMTALALRLAGQRNAVSRLHGRVSRRMWHPLWPDHSEQAVPITHVTNGVHTGTWLAPELRNRLAVRAGCEPSNFGQPAHWSAVDAMPDDELWSVHQRLKVELLEYLGRREQIRRAAGLALRDAWPADGLHPDALTIGFARRVATYKRLTLIFSDFERLRAIMGHPERPVVLILAGKAHPADEPARALVPVVFEFMRRPGLAQVVFVEDYDLAVARAMVRGVDVWLNTPVPYNEACGTSGMKAAMNGVLNCSVLDGWWAEAYDGHNGWAIGGPPPADHEPEASRDLLDSTGLYRLLEEEIVPLYHERGADGVPSGWVRMMKAAIRSLGYAFSAQRMLEQYVQRFYVPSAGRARHE
jgi:starch phosphorylase